jgi:glycine hydroxymethyltransferase
LATRVEAPGLGGGVKNVNDLSEADWEKMRNKLGNQRLMGMSLDAGGHLTHGFRPNISGKMFHQRSYGTDPKTELLDYDALAAAAREFKPLILVGGYSAYPRRIGFAKRARSPTRSARRDGRHGALRRPGRGQGVHRRRGPCAARPRHHDHHAQVAAWAARRAGAGDRPSPTPWTRAAQWCWAGRCRM